LDRQSEIKVQEALLWFRNQGKTIIVIAHRLSTIRHCDVIKLLKGGIIAEEGSHDELLQAKGFYSEMWNAHQSF
jgi:ATP-binding cassette subfamily B protein